ncbi:MAG: biotin/lipoyl-containing protein [Caldilineaceae bacterium]
MAEFRYTIDSTDGEPIPVRVEPNDSGYRIEVNGRAYQITAQLLSDGQLNLVVDGQQAQGYVVATRQADQDLRLVWLGGQSWSLLRHEGRQRRRDKRLAAAEGALTAAMPGQVRAVLVTVGDQVAAGAPLVILEAMKMELRVTAPKAGVVAKVHCAVDEVVKRGQRLVELAAPGGEP